MVKLESYRDLIAYKKAYELTLEIYKHTQKFPDEERYGLVSQMRRAAISIPSNIAEGYRRRSRKEYIRFLYISWSSCGELETQLSIAFDLNLISKNNYDNIRNLLDFTSKLIYKLIESLK